MKRTVAIICLLCYIASATGMSFSVDYCNDKLKGLSWPGVNDSRCCCDDEQIDRSCCESNEVKVQKTDDHQVNQQRAYILSAAEEFTLPQFPLPLFELPSLYHTAVSYNLPPHPLLKNNFPLYKLFSVFRV